MLIGIFLAGNIEEKSKNREEGSTIPSSLLQSIFTSVAKFQFYVNGANIVM
jgi:hypothetical protein